MKAEKGGVKKRIAKRAPQTARVAKPSRTEARAAPVARPAPQKLLASADLSHSLIYRIRRAQLWVFKDVSRRLAAFEISPSQFFVLSVIEANPGVNQLAIAQSLSIERAGLGSWWTIFSGAGPGAALRLRRQSPLLRALFDRDRRRTLGPLAAGNRGKRRR